MSENLLESQPVESFAALPRARRRRLMIAAVLRSTLVTAILLTAYFLLPFTLARQVRSLTVFAVGMLVVGAVLTGQFIRTVRSPYPRLRAVEALLTTGPLFVVLFASIHYVAGQLDPAGYSEALNRLDALYFTVTTFATVGFGDITPQGQATRLVTLVQMVCGLILVGVIAKLLFGVAQESDRLRLTADPAVQHRPPRLPPSPAQRH